MPDDAPSTAPSPRPPSERRVPSTFARPPAVVGANEVPDSEHLARGSLEPSDAAPIATAILRPRRGKQIRLLLTSLVLATPALFHESVLLVICGAFFGLCSAALFVLLLPGAAYLAVDARGFTVCSFFKKHFTAWSDVSEFGVAIAGGREMVGYDDPAGAQRHAKLAAVSVALSGYTSALPDTYGVAAAELAAFMSEMRRRALASDLNV